MTGTSLLKDRPLILTRFPNGGWTVVQKPLSGVEPQPIGAYGSAVEMVRDLEMKLSQL